MRKILFTLAAVMALSACQMVSVSERGNGVPANVTIEAGSFSAIAVPSSIDVYYTQTTGAQSIILTCDENLADYYIIEVEGTTLMVKVRPGTIVRSKAETYLTVKSPVLNGLKVSGSGDIHLESPVTTDGDFSIKISGSGDISSTGTVTCRNFLSSTSGSGDLFLSGIAAESAEFRISGSGDVSARNYTVWNTSISISGSGDLSLACLDAGTIDVRISGSGDVTLSGNARSLGNISTPGSGGVDFSRLTLSGR